jgi:hypothetical protein
MQPLDSMHLNSLKISLSMSTSRHRRVVLSSGRGMGLLSLALAGLAAVLLGGLLLVGLGPLGSWRFVWRLRLFALLDTDNRQALFLLQLGVPVLVTAANGISTRRLVGQCIDHTRALARDSQRIVGYILWQRQRSKQIALSLSTVLFDFIGSFFQILFERLLEWQQFDCAMTVDTTVYVSTHTR